MIAFSLLGFLGVFGKQSPTFLVGLVMSSLAFLGNLYVLVRLVEEIRVSNRGLDVRMTSGRLASIAWSEVSRLRISPRRDRFRVETNSGLAYSVESSLPGYLRLLRLIEQQLK